MAEEPRVETAEGDSDSSKGSAMCAASLARSTPEETTVRKPGIKRQLRQTIRHQRHLLQLPQFNPQPLSQPQILKLLTPPCEGLLEEREPGWATR